MNAINHYDFLSNKNWNINSNKCFKININSCFNSLKPQNFIVSSALKKKLHLLSPTSFPNNQKIEQIIAKKSLKNRGKLFNTNNNILNYKIIKTLKDYSIERPKVHIKQYSAKHKNDYKYDISSEKNNNNLKYRTNRVKPRIFKSTEKTIFSPYKTNEINENIKFNMINSINNIFEHPSDNHLCKKNNREYSNINHYYNLMQGQNFNSFNNIDNIIKKQPYTNYINTRKNNFQNENENYKKLNNERNINNRKLNNNCQNNLNHLKKIIYRKKIQQKKNNYSDIFSTIKVVNIEQEQESEKKDLNLFNKDNTINNIFLSNTLNDNKTYKLIYDNYQTPQKLEEYSKTCNDFEDNNQYSNTCSNNYISFTFTEPKFTTLENEQNNNEYIKIENYNNNRLNLSNNNYKNNYKLMGLLNSNNKNKKLNENKNLNICKSAVRKNKIIDFNSTKSSSDILVDLNKNSMHKHHNNTIGNNYVFGYSASTINDNTINTLNSAEKSITVFNNDINTNLNPNRTLVEKSNISNTINFIYPKNETLNGTINKMAKKKLKNIITSIQYKNRNFKDHIILSEIEQNGKLNVKYRKMKNSIEKIIKQNSIPNVKKIYCIKKSQIPYNGLTYVKKNQGTQLRKPKKYNTIHRI